MAGQSELAACLDETRAAAFAAGNVSDEQRVSIENHVDDCAGCRQVLAALVKGDGAPDAWTPGTRVGRYVVRGRLGRGAMGTVYHAEDLELGRAVALKRLHGGERERLVREARVAAQLAHPNIVTVYEVGEADGAAFLAMELVDGVTLRAWLAEPHPRREVVRVIADAGRGLAAAHERGIVHRDFKPDNVLVDRSGRARVADFGLARAEVVAVTQSGSVAGTPAYMAPEVVAGEAPDARSDQFALAVTLFAALHGAHPFEGDTARRMWTEMAHGRIREGKRDVPAWLDRIVRRGLAVDPAARWPDVASLVAALGRPPRKRWPYAAGAGGAVAIAALAFVIARRTSDAPAVASPCDRFGADLDELWPAQKAPIEQHLGAAAPRFVAAFDALAAQWGAIKHDACLAEAAPDLAARQEACMGRVRSIAKATLTSSLASPPDALGFVGDLPDVAQCGDPARLQATPVLAPEVLPAYMTFAGDAVAARQLFEAGDLHHASRSLGWATNAMGYPMLAALAAQSETLLVEIEADLGEDRELAENMPRALEAARASHDPDQLLDTELVAHVVGVPGGVPPLPELVALAAKLPTSRAAVRVNTLAGAAELRANEPTHAETALRRAATVAAQVLPPDDPERALATARVADAVFQAGRYAEARPLLDAARAALATHAGRLRREAIATLRDLAGCELADGNHARAAELYREVVARNLARYGDESVVTQLARTDLIAALDASGERAAGNKVVADFVAAIRPTGYSNRAAEAMLEASGWLDDCGRHDDADPLARQALPIISAEKGPDHPNTAIAEYVLFRAQVERPVPRALDEATHLLDHVERIFRKAFGDASEAMLAVGESRAELLAARGELAAADRAYIQALAMLGPDAVRARASLERLRAAALTRLGRRDEARTAADAAVRDFAALGPSMLRDLARSRAVRAALD